MPVKPKVPKTKPETEVDETTSDSDEVMIEFRGAEFVIPRNRDDWPTRAILEFSRARSVNDQIRGLEIMLGPTQWNRLVDDVASTSGQFDEFVDLFSTTVNRECIG